MPAEPRTLRADAARNRDKLLAAAEREFGERGLDVPLEHIARRAGVSIGTLYAHFPTREALLDAVVPQRLSALDRVVAAALAEPDPWDGFVAFVEGVFALQAQDRGLNDALARRLPPSPEVARACRRGMEQAELIIARAKAGGRLRADFDLADLSVLTWAISQVIRQTADTAPLAWRRCLAFYLDGLRAGAAHPVVVPALSRDQLTGPAPRS